MATNGKQEEHRIVLDKIKSFNELLILEKRFTDKIENSGLILVGTEWWASSDGLYVLIMKTM